LLGNYSDPSRDFRGHTASAVYVAESRGKPCAADDARHLAQVIGEKFSLELGARLGQGSEFSLLVSYSALAIGVIDLRASYLIQMVVMVTFVLSTYWVVHRYRTPISSTEKNRMD